MNLKKNRMNKRNFIIAIILAAFVGAFVALTTYKVVNPKDEHYNSIQERQNVKLSNYNLDDVTVPEGLNFIEAAKLVTPGVVGVTGAPVSADSTFAMVALSAPKDDKRSKIDWT